MAARTFYATLAAVAAAMPSGGAAQKAFLPYDPNAGASYDRTDTGTVPASPYSIELDLGPLAQYGTTITVGGVARTKVRMGTQASGQVGIDYVSGKVAFHSSDAGGSYSVAYRGRGSVITHTDMNILQNEIAYLRAAAATFVVGPASATDNAFMRFDGTTGKLAQNSSGSTLSDAGVAVFAGNVSGANLSGTNSGDLTLSGTTINALFSLATQVLTMDAVAANSFLAGPTSGSPAIPTVRTMVDADLATTSAALLAVANFWTALQTFNDGVLFDYDFNGSGTPTGISGEFQTKLTNVPLANTSYTFWTVRANVTSDVDIQTLNFQMQASGSTASANILWANTSGTPMVAFAGTAYLAFSGGTLTASAINLASHVTGTLPIANGGTNSTATATAGGVGYGTGSAHAYTSAGTSGQVLTSAGASAPTWATPFVGTGVQTSDDGSVPDMTTTLSANYITASGQRVIASFSGVGSGGTARIRFGGANLGTTGAINAAFSGDILAIYIGGNTWIVSAKVVEHGGATSVFVNQAMTGNPTGTLALVVDDAGGGSLFYAQFTVDKPPVP